MKKQKTFSIIASIVIGLVFAIGLSYVSAAWTNPTATPPGANLSVPVNTSGDSQVKTANLSVGTFIDNWGAIFEQRVHFRGLIYGGGTQCSNSDDDDGDKLIDMADPGCSSPTDDNETDGGPAGAAKPVLKIGGLGSNSGIYSVVATVNGNVKSQGTLGSTELVNNQMTPLCSDDKGHVILCSQITTIACNVKQSGTYGVPNSANQYPEMIYDVGTSTSVALQYDAHDVPNRFNVYTYPDDTPVVATGWIGDADYGGPWGGPSLHTPPPWSGTIAFTATQRYYKIIVNTATGPTVTDAWDAKLICP